MSPASREAPRASAPLGPFDPPYAFSGSALIVVGLLRGVDPACAPPQGFRPLGLFAGELGMMILCDYREPPAELPLRYRELIAARLIVRRLTLASQAVDMVLDEKLPVELGQRYYDLPKRHDAALRLEGEGQGRCTGQDAELRWHESGPPAQLVLWPWRLLFALALGLFTAVFSVFGAGPRPKRARIALWPRTLGKVVHVAPPRLGKLVLSPLFAFRFARVATQLGAPSAFH